MRVWSHGGASAHWTNPYKCRLCRKKTWQSLRGLDADRICPWCAVEVGKRTCEALGEIPPGNFFYRREDAVMYSMLQCPDRIGSDVRKAVLKRDNYTCNHCGSTDQPHVDHKLPASRGGLPVIENLWVLCRLCNSHKRTSTVEEWLAKGGRATSQQAAA